MPTETVVDRRSLYMSTHLTEFDDELPSNASPLDRELHYLIRKAQQEPHPSPRRGYYVTRLLTTLYRSGQLARPQRGCYGQSYEEIYAVAWSMTAEYISKKVDDYHPTKGHILHLTNNTLKFRFCTAVTEFFKLHGAPKNFKAIPIEDLYGKESFIHEANEHSGLWEDLIQLIEEDPDDRFKSVHLKGKPEATYQRIFLLKWRDKYKLREIAEKFDTRITTVQTHLDRNNLKFRDYICNYFQS